MVRQGFPMVWRPSEFKFLDLREIDGKLFQILVIEDQNGRFHVLHYEMLRNGNVWQINGVQIMRAPTVGS